MSMVIKIENKNKFKTLNKRSWEENADFVIENGLSHEYIESLLKGEIKRLLEENTSFDSLLDVGCGNGWLRSIVPSDIRYIGIDNCEGIISRLQSHSPAFYTLDIEEDLNDDQVKKLQSDILVSSMSLIETPYLDSAISNLYKLTNSRGYVLITSLNPNIEIMRISNNLDEYKENLALHSNANDNVFIAKKIRCNDSVSKSDYHRILYSASDIIQQAKKSGFKLIDFKERERREMSISQPAIQYILLKK